MVRFFQLSRDVALVFVAAFLAPLLFVGVTDIQDQGTVELVALLALLPAGIVIGWIFHKKNGDVEIYDVARKKGYFARTFAAHLVNVAAAFTLISFAINFFFNSDLPAATAAIPWWAVLFAFGAGVGENFIYLLVTSSLGVWLRKISVN